MDTVPLRALPTADLAAARGAASAFARHGHVLAAFEALHDALGDVFRLPLPGFDGVVLVGPEANRFLLVDARDSFRWRAEGDPVTRLLRQGVLVTDGALHDEFREMMTPALHRRVFDSFIASMNRSADRVISDWRDGTRVDLLTEMRRVALLVLVETLFRDDFGPRMTRLWPAVLRTIRYISPGPWLVWPGVPRLGYARAVRRLDGYFHGLIARRRARAGGGDDLVGALIDAGLSDEVIRDQLLTLFIAGHDTSTASLAWTFYTLATHPDALARAREEVDAVLGDGAPTAAHLRPLRYLECVIKETARLYPPIHLGSRIAAVDIEYQGYRIPAGTRVVYSIYLTHRDRRHWPEPERFDPDRFAPESHEPRNAYSYLPFGGGPRNCLGAAFAQVEAKVVVARILQRYDVRFVGGRVRPRMRATLEPNPGVLVEVRKR